MNSPTGQPSGFNKAENTGIRHFINAFHFSIKGLKAAFKHEAAFRQELGLSVVLIPLAFWVGNGPAQISLLVLLNFILVVVELLNSAVEAVVDRVGSEHHELSGQAKDMGSAAVMVTMIGMGSVWLIMIYANWQRISTDITNLFIQ